MPAEAILIDYPTFVPIILLTLGALYFNFIFARRYSHFHWNLFMIAVGLLAIGFVVRLLNIYYAHIGVEIVMAAVFAFSAVVFAFTSYVAVVGDKSWRL